MIKADKSMCVISGNASDILVEAAFVVASVFQLAKDDLNTADVEAFFKILKTPVEMALETTK